jgi:hypothetical protein
MGTGSQGKYSMPFCRFQNDIDRAILITAQFAQNNAQMICISKCSKSSETIAVSCDMNNYLKIGRAISDPAFPSIPFA